MASGDRSRRRWLFRSLLASLAASLAIASTTLAGDPPIYFHKSTGASPAPAAARSSDQSGLVTFPRTSTAPLRWKSSAPIAQAGHVAQAASLRQREQAGSSLHGERGIIRFGAAPTERTASQAVHLADQIADDSVVMDREVRRTQFTLQLDSPKNGEVAEETSDVQPAAGTENSGGRPRSVLSSRRPKTTGSTKANPFNDPFGDRQSPPLSEEPPLLNDAVSDSSDHAEEIVIEEEDTLVQQEAGGDFQPLQPARPPMPAADPDDPAPTPPPSLRTQPTPQRELSEDDPSPNPLKDLPTEPNRLGGASSRDCGVYNERDCCEDGEECLKSLNYVKADALRSWDVTRLDITPRYKPDADTPEEIEAAEERKAQQLKLSGIRDWKDRDGRIVAHGQLIDLSMGKAIIEDESGQQSQVKLRTLSDDDLCFMAAWYNVPTECTLGNDPYQQRAYLASTFTWKASALCHKPLYFEEVQLERYGHTTGPIAQPFVSGAHFFLNIALLPYKMGINPPQECQYSLGYYRPGSCAPWMVPPFPLSTRGAATAAGVYTGGVFLIP